MIPNPFTAGLRLTALAYLGNETAAVTLAGVYGRTVVACRGNGRAGDRDPAERHRHPGPGNYIAYARTDKAGYHKVIKLVKAE